MANKMMNVKSGAKGPTDLGGAVTDGEETNGTPGSSYNATLVERSNKSANRNQHTGRTALQNKDGRPGVTMDSRKTGRVAG